MNFKQVLVSELKPADYNPRKKLQPKDPEYQRIKKSIEEFGYVDPIIINSDYTVIGGHQRLAVLKELGHAKIDVVVVDLPKTKEKALNVALNKITGEWDFTQLSIVLSELKEEDFDISITGFSEKELKEIDEELFGKQIKEDDYEPPPEIQTTIKRGDIITLGRHRVMCGDSTSKEDVGKLMDGKKADMVSGDPPYGMGAVENSGVLKRKYKNIEGDSDNSVAVSALKLWNSSQMVWWGANYYANNLPPSSCWLVWNKDNGASDQMDAELAWTNFKGVTRMFTLPSEKTNRYHPTQKPVRLIVWYIERWGKNIKIIVDPFLGSGTTLIACEQLNRICYGMEISPQYCEVICQRWEKYTGQKRVMA